MRSCDSTHSGRLVGRRSHCSSTPPPRLGPSFSYMPDNTALDEAVGDGHVDPLQADLYYPRRQSRFCTSQHRRTSLFPPATPAAILRYVCRSLRCNITRSFGRLWSSAVKSVYPPRPYLDVHLPRWAMQSQSHRPTKSRGSDTLHLQGPYT